jgi:carotenoid cleavage dioxygenase-like enzyme
MRLSEGVIARVKLPFRLHSQVHGNWVSPDQVAVA